MSINRLHVNTAKRDIERTGKYTQYHRRVQGVYDPSTMTTTNTEVSSTFKAFNMAVNRNDISDPSLINKETSVFLISGESFTNRPKQGDKLTYLIEYPLVDPVDWDDYYDNQPDSNKITVEVFNSRPIYAGSFIGLWKLLCVAN